MSSAHKQPWTTTFPCLQVSQAHGSFFTASLPASLVWEISLADVRRIEGERDFETYLGIQRPLNNDKVLEICRYLANLDASFPTSIIISVSGRCVTVNESNTVMTLTEYIDDEDRSRDIPQRRIANILDGQHRIEALRRYTAVLSESEPHVYPTIDMDKYMLPVTIYCDIDTATEAYIFSTVNLMQTRVNKSMAIDLVELSKWPSPQKFAHGVAVALDRTKNGPFYRRIMRLGRATPGRTGEALSLACVVDSLMNYLSEDPMLDRAAFMQQKRPLYDPLRDSWMIFRKSMIEGDEVKVYDVVQSWFLAVRDTWPLAWDDVNGRGAVLPKTNGFRALMRLLKPAYERVGSLNTSVKDMRASFHDILKICPIKDRDFSTELYKPGTSGESQLYRDLLQGCGLVDK